MINEIKNRDYAISQVIEGLTYLILNHARCCASEQYAPSQGPDESGDYIKEHKQWVIQLSDIRRNFETLVTGLL